MLDRLADGFFAVDQTWRFTYLNTAAERLLKRSRAELLGTVIWDQFPHAEAFERQYREAMQTGLPVRFEAYYRPLRTWFGVRAHPDAAGLSVYFEDATERHRAERRHLTALRTEAVTARAALADLNRQYDLILQSAGDGIVALDANTRIQYVNPAASRLLGYAPEELLGRGFHATVHHSRPDGTPYPFEECPGARARTGETVYLERDMFWRRDGMPLLVDYTSAPILRNGAVIGIAVIFRDISERVRAEEALRVSEDRLRRALTAARMAVWEQDLATGKVLWSPEAESLLGFPPGSLRGDSPDYRTRIHPDDLPALEAAVAEAVERQGPCYTLSRVIQPDGSVRWFEGRGQVQVVDGQPRRLVGTVMDVTDRRAAEHTLAEQARLLARLEERERIAMDLHDTVIQALYGVSLLLQGQLRPDPGDPRAWPVTLGHATTQIAAVIQELRGFIFNLRRDDHASTSLGDGLRLLVEEVRLNTGIQLSMRLARDTDTLVPPDAVPDVLAIAREALANVIRHARATRAQVRLARARASVTLTIEDDGHGFDPSSVTRHSGLGTMEQRTARLRGKLRVESQSGKGTRVRLRLPPFTAV